MINSLSNFVTMMLALSVATERLVEIIKGLIPFLNSQNDNDKYEGWRRASLHLLAVAAGIVTSFLAQPFFPPEVQARSTVPLIIGIGLLASGGSGFWNSILSYLGNVKDLKKAQVDQVQSSGKQA